MRLIAKLYVVSLFTVILFMGCDQGMSQPIKEIIPPPETPTNLEKATADMARVNQRRTESQQKADTAGNYTAIFIDSENILIEELEFRKAFWIELVDIFRSEKTDDATVTDGYGKLQDAFAKRLSENTLGQFYFEYIRTFDPLIVEYLRLSYVYPTQTEEELLAHFRESVRNDTVSIVFPENF